MPTIYEIPTSATPQTFAITLAGVTYNMRLLYCGALAAPQPSAQALTVINCDFKAPDNTLLENFSDATSVGSIFTLRSDVSGKIVNNAFLSSGGTPTYIASGLPLLPDYIVRFNVVPANGDLIGTSSAFAIGRADGTYNGYKAEVTSDRTQYYINLTVMGNAASTVTRPLGILTPRSFFTVVLTMTGTMINVSVLRDGLWLNLQGVWVAQSTVALSVVDATYTLPGRVIMGCYSPPVVVAPIPIGVYDETGYDRSVYGAELSSGLQLEGGVGVLSTEDGGILELEV